MMARSHFLKVDGLYLKRGQGPALEICPELSASSTLRA